MSAFSAVVNMHSRNAGINKCTIPLQQEFEFCPAMQIGACKDVENGAFDLNPNRVEGFVTADLNLDMLQFERTS